MIGCCKLTADPQFGANEEMQIPQTLNYCDVVNKMFEVRILSDHLIDFYMEPNDWISTNMANCFQVLHGHSNLNLVTMKSKAYFENAGNFWLNILSVHSLTNDIWMNLGASVVEGNAKKRFYTRIHAITTLSDVSRRFPNFLAKLRSNRVYTKDIQPALSNIVLFATLGMPYTIASTYMTNSFSKIVEKPSRWIKSLACEFWCNFLWKYQFHCTW